jgi:hypothetical protein
MDGQETDSEVLEGLGQSYYSSDSEKQPVEIRRQGLEGNLCGVFIKRL